VTEDPAREWLHRRWVHSHEEDRAGDMVFRPSGFPFPPSRGRRAFELRSGGTLGHAQPGPADRPALGEGRWEIEGDTLKLFRESAAVEAFHIASAAPDRLVLRRV
jgi:hypothetical protein